MVNLKSLLVVKLVNKLVDLRCLQHKLFLLLHSWQNLADFIGGFLLIIQYVVTTYHFSEVIDRLVCLVLDKYLKL